ncbi:MAG: hypothetical protein AAFY28_21815, partial [Actinomycetota bacterium]
MPSARGFQAALAGQTAAPMAAVGKSSASKFGSSFTKGLKAAGIGAAAGAAIGVGVGTALAKLGGSFKDAYDGIRADTGATGE